MAKITIKSKLVWDYFNEKCQNHKTYKQVFEENKADIAEKFGITTYAGFRYHCTKVFNKKQEARNG
jgi:hypothetical protein